MKKQILLMGLVAAGAIGLSGCSDHFDEILGPHEVEGHKMVSKLEDGKQYYMGVFDPDDNGVKFINGDYHTDEKGFYPFYMAKNTKAGLENAAKVEVQFTKDNHFRLLVHTPKKDQKWSEKYITLYEAVSSYSNKVMSIHAASDPEEKSFKSEKDGKTYKVAVNEFEFLECYEEVPIYSAAAAYVFSAAGEEDPVYRVFGTGINGDTNKQHISVDCKSIDQAIDANTYWIAHFFEA